MKTDEAAFERCLPQSNGPIDFRQPGRGSPRRNCPWAVSRGEFGLGFSAADRSESLSLCSEAEPRQARPIVVTLLAGNILIAALSWIYFFPKLPEEHAASKRVHP
ncbi:MAG: hypothetical protein ACHQZS_12420 [Candidatus Binatales bacterium]